MELPERVRPGDLITAELMNSILDKLDVLEEKVDALEGATVDDGSVAITQLVPPATAGAPIQVGQELRILGRNFGFLVGSHRVYFNSTQVTTYKAGSSNTQLVVDVPQNLAVPPGGAQVVLTVSNGTSFATRDIFVLPVQQTLSGDVDVLWRDTLNPNPNPNPIPNPATAGTQTVTFGYRLRSRANIPATFTVTPNISVTAWQGGLQVLNASNQVVANRQFQLAPNQEVNFSVRATLTPAGGAGSFTLNVVASSGPVLGASTRLFTFGTPVEPGDDAIDLAFTEATVFSLDTGDPAPEGGGYDEATNTISVAPSHLIVMGFEATFHEAANYTVTAQTGGGASNWTVELISPNTGTFDETGEDVPVTEQAEFSVRPSANASAGGQLTFRIQRQGQTSSQTRTFTLARLDEPVQ